MIEKECLEQRSIILSVKVAIVIVIFVITSTASVVTTWGLMANRVKENTSEIAINAEAIEKEIDRAADADKTHMRLINSSIQASNDLRTAIVGLEKDIKYIIMMVEKIQ